MPADAMAAQPTSARPWQRHELLRIAPGIWASALTARPPLAELPLLATWADRGWPLIVRRRMEGDGPGLVPVGVPLPPAAGKLRIALTVPEEAVVGRSPPPALRTAARAAAPAWRPTIARLLALGARHGVEPEAFGSLLWQHLTGLTYLSSQSDLDVLWPVHAGCDIRSLLAGIAGVEDVAPLRIDGEVVFPDGRAVNWRELQNNLRQGGPAEILVKSIEGVQLLDVTRLPCGGWAA